MTTGSIQSKALTLSKHFESFQVFLTLTAAVALSEGQTVYLSGDNEVTDIDALGQYPIGIVSVGGALGEKCTVATNFARTLEGHNADASAMVAGAFVRQNGVVNANGRPEFVPAVVDDLGPTAESIGDWATGVVMLGAAAAGPIKVGILRMPTRPTPVAVT